MVGSRPKREIAEQFASALKRELGATVERVILYGSVARGDDTPTSDIDLIAVVADKRRQERLWSLVGRWLADTGVLIEVLVVTPDELRSIEARGSEFAHAVEDEGEVLV